MDFLFQSSSEKPTKKSLKHSKEFLNSLPFAIKHSLFLESDMMLKMRELSDIAQLFFITDDTKLKGNQAYDLGKYYEALEVYEQVLGCYVWLQYKDPTL